MHRFINLYYTNKNNNTALLGGAASPSSANVVTCEANTKLDTCVCLLSNNHDKSSSYHRPLLVSGLVNTGNSCFLNSVLQSLSSLPKLQEYLNSVDKLPTSMELPVTRSLLKTLKLLTVPSNHSFRPTELVSAMSSNRRVINREQQDAQELFQLISGELDNENQMTKKKQGFRDLLFSTAVKKRTVESPFTGLLANRLSCIQCGYTEAIRHFSFNNVQLTLPNADATTLDDCLKQLTTMEYLNDVTCRKCSLIDTVEKLTDEISLLQSSQKIEKLHCLEKIKQDVEHRLDVGRIAEESHDDSRLKGFLSKVCRASSKQAMFAKPPKVLCLHIARSSYLPTGEIYKNTCQIQFPQLLDLAPYCTTGTLNTQPLSPISIDNTTSSSSNSSSSSVRYRLMSTIVHFGSHNFGHFIAYKRRLVAEKCNCDACTDDVISLTHHDSDWFKISDERVDTCTVDEVLSANPYMLLYELIDDDISDNVTPTTQNISTMHVNHQMIQQQVVEESEESEEDEDCISHSIPNAPPSSPLLLPLQLSSCSSAYPLTQPKRRRDSTKNSWAQTPVAIY
ncbi:hypothetical protein BDF21DRAFT_394011 [Thamnidium elegans]|uniref:Ubiquitin carboxyl-terminal hydrolase n=1 Tax=Thamnidium elegans TaxID=101142 RepID=A0A8H7VPT9_9FUNG|nr:hypothetical protein INT48_006015 [Thamnidium elegans]KAI8095699.1 hypothetical protein BDF21DRAFT_394011 [Thamnidium elegans]